MPDILDRIADQAGRLHLEAKDGRKASMEKERTADLLESLLRIWRDGGVAIVQIAGDDRSFALTADSVSAILGALTRGVALDCHAAGSGSYVATTPPPRGEPADSAAPYPPEHKLPLVRQVTIEAAVRAAGDRIRGDVKLQGEYLIALRNLGVLWQEAVKTPPGL